jgi:hypothetical protein
MSGASRGPEMVADCEEASVAAIQGSFYACWKTAMERGRPVEFLTAVAGHLSKMNQPSNAVSGVYLN